MMPGYIEEVDGPTTIIDEYGIESRLYPDYFERSDCIMTGQMSAVWAEMEVQVKLFNGGPERLAEDYWILSRSFKVDNPDDLYDAIEWATGWGDEAKRDEDWNFGDDAPYINDIEHWPEIYREEIRFQLALEYADKLDSPNGDDDD